MELTPNISNISDECKILKKAYIKKTPKENITNKSGEKYKNFEFIEFPDLEHEYNFDTTKNIDKSDNKFDEKILLNTTPEIYSTIEPHDELGGINNFGKEKVIHKNLKKENSLFCKFCNFDGEMFPKSDAIFTTQDALREHIECQHFPISPDTCLMCCNKNCRHHISYERKKTRVICQVCGIECDSAHLRIHLKTHNSSDFKCETCGKMFLNTSLAKFEYHQRWHNTKKQKKCEYCGKVFVQGGHLTAHLMKHTKNFSIKCEICEKGCRSQYAKKIHMHKAHGAEKPVKCLYCEKRFITYSIRAKHMIETHNYILDTIDEKLKCPKCDRLFRRETGLRKHLAMDCQGVREKVKYKPVKNISCPYCDKLFDKDTVLTKHLKLHSEEGRAFKCDICHLNYKTHSHLDLHKRIKHSNLKPFVCDICGASFKVNSILKTHKKFHKGKVSTSNNRLASA